jgi:hypothetical protein
MSKIETSEIPLPKKNITSGTILEKCSLNMREWASCHETMDPTDKSKYSAKWLWDNIMHTIILYEWPTEIRDEGEPHLRPIDWSQSPSLVATWQNIRDIRRASLTAEIE